VSILDVGQVLFGTYKLDVTVPCGAILSRQISVRPGQDKLETIVCPSQGTAPVHLNLVKNGLSDVPEHLREKLWYSLAFFPQPAGSESGWTNNSKTGARIYVTPRGQFAVVLWKNGQCLIKTTVLQPQTNPFWQANDIAALAYSDKLELTDTVNLPIGQYYLSYSNGCNRRSSVL